MHEIVQDYYGRQLQHTDDLKTSACCDAGETPEWLKPLLANVHPDVLARYYGCGLVCPPLLEGCRVLDLGCGSGRDVYLLSQLVGPTGEVVGVDMTEEQLSLAEGFREYHQGVFGFGNVRFLRGYIERLDEVAPFPRHPSTADAEPLAVTGRTPSSRFDVESATPSPSSSPCAPPQRRFDALATNGGEERELYLEPGSFDVIVSNCVINLSPDKDKVLAGAHRLLKPGGEIYFSDVYADRRVPDAVRNDPVLYGECLGGALYWNDFLSVARRNGFGDPRLVEDRPLTVDDPELAERTGNIRFFSATYRLFKLDGLESDCEDYGQAVIYRGSIPRHKDSFLLDKHHRIETGRVFPVCGNTWRMLHGSRFQPHFDFIGDFSRHYGIFDGCGCDLPFDQEETGDDTSGACC